MTMADTTPALTNTPFKLGRRIWPVLVGPTVWGTHLIVGYFGGAVACGTENSGGWFGRSSAGHGFILVVTVIAAVILLATILWSFTRRRRVTETPGGVGVEAANGEAVLVVEADSFVDMVAIGVNVFSLAGVLLEGIWAVLMRC